MTGTELWLTYHLASRSSQVPTVQLIEIDEKLFDLEDVLCHGAYFEEPFDTH